MNLNKIFTNPNRWMKNGRAKYRDGSSVPFCIKYGEKIKEPWSFSLYGAVSFFSDQETDLRSKTMGLLSKAISIYSGRDMFVAEFNDSPDTSFDDITAVIRIYNKLKDDR